MEIGDCTKIKIENFEIVRMFTIIYTFEGIRLEKR